MPAVNMTIIAKWKINQYTITFNTNGGTEIKSITDDYGASIEKPDDPIKEGYKFNGWNSEIPNVMPAVNMTIVAEWKINQYTITFKKDAETEIRSITADYGTPIEKPDDPIKEGYKFIGWNSEIPDVMPAVNMTIVAEWKINQYTITFKKDPENEIKSITADYSTPIDKPDDPMKEGYKFIGWDPEIPNLMPPETMTITAQWELVETKITYTDDNWLFDSNDNKIDEIKKCKTAVNGEITVLSYVVTHINYAYATTYGEYYNFVGWYTTDGIKLTDERGAMLESVPNYTNADGHWINECESITLISGWCKEYDGYEYISTPEELQNIGQSGQYMLIDNINLTDISWSWTPIASFGGTLNGTNKTITGLNCNYAMKAGGDSWGLFIELNKATISGINFENVNINSANLDNKNGKFYLGTLAAYAEDSTITQITVKGQIQSAGAWRGDARVGGIIGEANSCTISDCTNYAEVYGAKGSARVGGIVGWCSGTNNKQCKFLRCSNEGKITAVTMVYHGYADAAGIVGTSKSKATSSFIECKNTGEILATKPEGIRYMRQDEITNYD